MNNYGNKSMTVEFNGCVNTLIDDNQDISFLIPVFQIDVICSLYNFREKTFRKLLTCGNIHMILTWTNLQKFITWKTLHNLVTLRNINGITTLRHIYKLVQ